MHLISLFRPLKLYTLFKDTILTITIVMTGAANTTAERGDKECNID